MMLSPGFSYGRSPEYTMEFRILPVRMSVNETSTLLLKLNEFLRSSGVAGGGNVVSNTLTLKNSIRKIQVSDDFSSTALRSAPDVSYSVYYDFAAREGSIKKVSISLSDYSREISVSGQSQEQVEALARLIYAELEEHETYLGGAMTRLLAFFALEAISILLFLFGQSHVKARFAAGALFASSFLVLGADSYLPGTAIYKGSSSILVRFGPEISFWGLLVTVAGLVVALMADRRAKHHKSAAQAKTPANGRQPPTEGSITLAEENIDSTQAMPPNERRPRKRPPIG